jgi:hypothetical protein
MKKGFFNKVTERQIVADTFSEEYIFFFKFLNQHVFVFVRDSFKNMLGKSPPCHTKEG